MTEETIEIINEFITIENIEIYVTPETKIIIEALYENYVDRADRTDPFKPILGHDLCIELGKIRPLLNVSPEGTVLYYLDLIFGIPTNCKTDRFCDVKHLVKIAANLYRAQQEKLLDLEEVIHIISDLEAK